MLYDIKLRTTYEYDFPVSAGRHVLRVLPRDLPGIQQVRTTSLELDPVPTEQRDIVDFFGNRGTHVAFRSPHDKLVFTMRTRVERQVVDAQLDISPDLAQLGREIRDVRSLDPESPHHFLDPSSRIRLRNDLVDYARERSADSGSVFEAAWALCQAIHADMKYDADATTVETPVEEAFELRRGVCQDFAHIMIAGLRGMGIPAAYVSGFLRTVPPEGQPRMEGADAMHAWVRVWCGTEAGWVELDPTNALLVGGDHIVVAHGRDYDDVPPIAGVLRTSGSHETEQAVDVTVVDEVPAA